MSEKKHEQLGECEAVMHFNGPHPFYEGTCVDWKPEREPVASPQATRPERICGNCGLPLVQTETEEACRELDKVAARLEARRAAQPAAGTTPPTSKEIEQELLDHLGFPDRPTKAEGVVLEAIWLTLLRTKANEKRLLSGLPTDEMPSAGTTPQAERTPLTYEQEVHAVLCASAANTEDLLRYFEAQAAQESKDAKKLTEKCIEWKRDDLRRIRALIPQALERREARAVAPVETVARDRN